MLILNGFFGGGGYFYIALHCVNNNTNTPPYGEMIQHDSVQGPK